MRNTLLSIALAAVCAGLLAVDVRGDLPDSDTIKDASFVAERTGIDRDELEKINRDFAAMFRLVRMDLKYKAPEKIRIDSKVGPAKLTLIVNGNTKYLKAPFKEEKDDLKKYPDKRQSSLDFGLVSGGIWSEWDARGVPDKKIEGTDCYVLKLTHKWSRDSGFQLLYFDKKSLKLVAREKFKDDGTMKMRNLYRNHKKAADGWLPQEVVVQNQAGKFGASLSLKNIKVNSGIDASQFDIP
jgi:outer membrane lipoprotein-sorting protein